VKSSMLLILLAGLLARPHGAVAQEAQLPPETPPAEVASVEVAMAAAEALPEERVHPVWENFEPRFRKTICPFDGEADYDPKIITCGDVLVPEDRTDPGSRLIRLAVMKAAATTDDPPGGTVVRLEGGPGGPGINALRARYFSGKEGLPFRKVSETVFFDQRGIGYSEPAICRAVPAAYKYGEPRLADGVARADAEMVRCLAEAEAEGAALSAYNSWQNALDVRDIRRALEIERWTIFGISYGTRLGQAVLLVDEPGIRAAILDSVVPSGPFWVDNFLSRPSNFRGAVAAIDAACAEAPGCRKAMPDFEAQIVALSDAYEAEPLILEGLPPRSATDGQVVLDGTLLSEFIFSLLYRRNLYSSLPLVLDALERRDAAGISALASQGGVPLGHAFGRGMALLTLCRDLLASEEEWEAGIARGGALGRRINRFEGVRSCGRLFPSSPDPTAVETTTDLPVLLASGAADPVTPPLYGDELARRMPNSTHVVLAHTGHGALLTSGACGRSILLAFVKEPGADLDTACAAEMAPPDFATSWRTTDKAYAFVSGIQKGERPVLPALSLLALIVAFIAYPAGAAGRLGDRAIAARPSLPLPLGRLASWLGAAASLGAIGLAGWLVHGWATTHAAGLVLGLPPSVGLAGWLSLLGLVLALAGAGLAVKALIERRLGIGSALGGILTALAAGGLFAFLTSVGAGPL
jgi:pimeloyl-ACP methyl ester carboxylesterase